jgi:hypothetical protein
MLGAWLFDAGVILQQQADLSGASNRLLRRCDRSWLADGQGQHHAGKQQHVSNRQDDRCILRSGWLSWKCAVGKASCRKGARDDERGCRAPSLSDSENPPP